MEAAAFIRDAVPAVPRIALVLGSGLSALAEGLTDTVAIPYDRVPHFPAPTVAGHPGNVVVGKLDGAGLIVLQGRFHYYEGHPLSGGDVSRSGCSSSWGSAR